jgi:hypothetical protein
MSAWLVAPLLLLLVWCCSVGSRLHDMMRGWRVHAASLQLTHCAVADLLCGLFVWGVGTTEGGMRGQARVLTLARNPSDSSAADNQAITPTTSLTWD